MATTRGKCTECEREDMQIVGGGLCGKCRNAAIEAGTYMKRAYKTKAAVASPPPPAAGVSAGESPVLPVSEIPQVDTTVAPLEPGAGTLLASDLVVPHKGRLEQDAVPVAFDERDMQLFQQLQNAAHRNRRTLSAEILYRLDSTFES